MKKSDKIPFFATRNAGECMNAAVEWHRTNMKVLFPWLLYLLLPLSIVQTIGLSSFIEDAVNDGHSVTGSMKVVFCFSLIGFTLLNALIWTLVRWDMDHEESLSTLTFKQIARPFCRNLWRMSILALIFGALTYFVFFELTEFFFVIPFLVLIILICVAPVIFLAPAYIIDNLKIVPALKRSYRLAKQKLGSLLGLITVLVVLLTVVWLVAMLLVMIIFGFTSTFSLSQPEDFVKTILLVFQYIMLICSTFASYIIVGTGILSGGYLYGSTAQETEDVTLIDDINHFENL